MSFLTVQFPILEYLISLVIWAVFRKFLIKRKFNLKKWYLKDQLWLWRKIENFVQLKETTQHKFQLVLFFILPIKKKYFLTSYN